jgi:hypothetical protein
VSRMTAKVAARVDQVYDMLVAGLSYRQILKLAKEKHGWAVSSRTVDTYVAHAKERLEAEAKIRRGAELGKAIARLDNQYFKADQRKDHRGATMIERERIELLNLRASSADDRDEVRRFLDALEGDD